MKQRKRTSIIWSLPKAEMQKIVANATTIAEILRYFELVGTGASRKTLIKRLNEDEINYSHIPLGLNANKNRSWSDTLVFKRVVPLEDVMVENSSYSRGALKKRLIREKILANQCAICELAPYWRGKRLVLVLDHINGINNDHRRENLRLLCPNCNSQQKTFCGKTKREKSNCINCGIPVRSKKMYCNDCCENDVHNKNRSLKQRRVERPPYDILLEELKEQSYLAVGRKYGVSDNAIRKWVRFYEKHEKGNVVDMASLQQDT